MNTAKSLLKALCLGVAAIGTIAAPVRAELISFDFTADIIAVDAALSSQFNTTQTITGSFTYDDATAAAGMGSATTNYTGAVTAFSLSVGTYNLAFLGGSSIEIANNQLITSTTDEYDQFFMGADLSGPSVGAFAPIDVIFGLLDLTATAFDSGALPASLDLADFTEAGLVLRFRDDDPTSPTATVHADVTSLVQQGIAIPEPGSLALFGLGLLGFSVMLRRRRRAPR